MPSPPPRSFHPPRALEDRSFLRFLVLFVPLLLAVACAPAPPPPADPVPVPQEEDRSEPEPEAEAGEEAAAEPEPGEEEAVLPPPEPEAPAFEEPTLAPREAAGPWADSVLATLTLREKIGQMIMPWILGDFAPEGSPSHDRVLRTILRYGVGGVIVSVGSPTEVAVKLNDLQGHSPLPLLVAADLETGAGFRLSGIIQVPTNIELGGATTFPSLMAVGATGEAGLAYEMGRITAVEARAVGIHVPFAPVLDVNNNADNPIISIRSFGEDPRSVATLGSAFVRGLQEYGAVSTGKHFPGHGDTETDSHLSLPVIDVDRDRLDRVELVPFRAAVEAGMEAIMTAHIAIPSVTGDVRTPSTLSSAVLDSILRREMRFDGVIFTDAMDMRAIDRYYSREEAAVRAVEAGADVLLMPPSIFSTVQGILDAVATGRISESRIDASVRRLLLLKERLGLHRQREVDLARVPRRVGIPDHMDMAQEIADRSITLLRDEGELIPLRRTRSADVLSISYRREADLFAGRYFNGVLGGSYPRLTTVEVERETAPSVYRGLLRQARRSSLVVVSVYSNFAGRINISPSLSSFLADLGSAGVPHVLVSFGSPYLIEEFPDVQSFLVAWGGTEVSQRAAARALLGDIEVEGRLPVRVPPFFRMDEGLVRPRRTANGG